MVTLSSILDNNMSNENKHGPRALDIEFQSNEELCYAIGYIVKNLKRIDAEIPAREIRASTSKAAYEISEGVTKGGHHMKLAAQYRLYFKSINNIPHSLNERLQSDKRKRMTGSKFIASCIKLGFCVGNAADQDFDRIVKHMNELFSEKEMRHFQLGYGASEVYNEQ